MGNMPTSLSLADWARYCDCLQSSQKFKFQQKPQQPSQNQSNIEQKIPQKKQQPRRALRQDDLKINIIPQLTTLPPIKLKQAQQVQKAKSKTQSLQHNSLNSYSNFYETPQSEPKSLIPRQRRNEARRAKRQQKQDSSEGQFIVPVSSIGNPKLKGRNKNASKLLSMKSSNFELDAIQISEIDEHHQQPSQDHSEYIIPEQKISHNSNYSVLN